MQTFEQATGYKAQPRPVDDRIYFDLGETQGARVFMVQSEMGAGGRGASLQTVQKGLEALSPAAVIMVGIACGVNAEQQTIGDILVTENLRLYELERVGTQDGQVRIILRGDRPHASAWLLNHFKSVDLLWDGAQVRFGVVLTGEKLVDNVDFRDQLHSFEPEAVGGEMEGAGLYVACQDQKVDWILVKAICDWADGQKEQDRAARQQTAAQNAATFVLHALQFAPVDWEKRRREAWEAAAYMVNTGDGSIAESGGVASGAHGISVGGNVGGNIFISPPPPEPSQPAHSSLPPQPFFFGREKELAIIADAVAPESRTWGVLIDGPGSIGKTALAIRAGHLAPEAHYPRKIFLSAKVRELTPSGEKPLEDFMLPNYVTLLTELARELGDIDLSRTPENDRANAVRRALANQCVLLVVDNVETFPEAERRRLYQFLGRLPTGCKAIVTSRRRSDVDARVIRLDRLEQKDALELVAELAKTNRYLAAADEQDRQTLYEVTGGNPLLLRWTAGQLGRRDSQCRTVAEACDYLQNAPRGNDPLEYIFGDLLDTFTETEVAVLAALTHFTQPAQTQWVVNIANVAERQAQTALEDLAGRALLVTDPTAEAFLLPPLAAKFLRDKRPGAVTETGDRLVNQAYALAQENGYHEYERFPVLEAEWPTIAAALPCFLQGDNSRLQSLCDALRNFLDFSGRWDDRLWLSQQAEIVALGANDFYNAGWQAHMTGWVYFLREQAADVLVCADHAEEHWRKANAGAREKATAIRLRGLGHRLRKDHPAAILAFQQTLELFRTLNSESNDVALALNSLATVEKDAGNYASAYRDYHEALRIAKNLDAAETIAICSGNLAELDLDRQD